jgi:D-glycero-D-manno-heptose 1,7-bisphosphate phosphatase
MTRAVFLDRDGVLNRGVTRDGRPWAPFSLTELEILPGVPDALAALRAAGFQLVVVTNQPDVSRGFVTRTAVDVIHEYMRQQLPLDEIRVCFHDDQDGCACRKPKPGMIFAAAVEREIQLARSFMVGDRWRDIGAGRAAGCRTILVNAMVETTRVEPDIELTDLRAAADWIMATARETR